MARLLNIAPVGFRRVLDWAAQAEDWVWFQELTRRILPNHAEAILARQDTEEIITAFNDAFDATYVPLCEMFIEWMVERHIHYVDNLYDDSSIWSYLKPGAPVEFHGFGDTDEHEIWDSDPVGCVLLLFIRTVSIGEDDPCPFNIDDGIKIAWWESASETISLEVLELIPELEHTHMIELLENAGHQEWADTYRWLTAETGYHITDTVIPREMHGDPEAYMGDGWDQEWLDELAAQRPFTDRIIRNVSVTMNQLAEAPDIKLMELLEILEASGVQLGRNRGGPERPGNNEREE